MPYTTPHIITAGELVTVATMNDEWGGNVAFLANPPASRVYNNAALTIANNTETALTFNSERYDTDAMHSTVTNTTRLTMTTAGLYVVTGSVNWVANATGTRQIGIRLAGTTYLAVELEPNAGASLVHQETISTVYKFTAGQYVELVAYQNSGGNLNINSAGNYSPEFSATWVGLG